MRDIAIVVLCSVPDSDTAQKLAHGLVSERLAGCVSVLPGVRSVYHWEGEVKTEQEELLIIKTRGGRLDKITDWLNDAHPYDVPEILALPVEEGNQAYMRWLDAATLGQKRLSNPPPKS